MARKRYELTDEIEQTILAFVRAGAFSHVAAEAAGIPRTVFDRWLRRGEGPRGPDRLRAFAQAIRQAQAQARLGAEATALTEKPLDWLRNGPGREIPGRAGWTGTVRPTGADRGGNAPLLSPAVQGLVAALLKALEPYPEARVAAAAVLEALPSDTAESS